MFKKMQKKAGLMPFQYEFEKSLRKYSITIDLEMIGVDKNFNCEADNKEKAKRVNLLLDAIQHLSLIVKGNLDNAESIFVVGGLSPYKTHFFENCVNMSRGEFLLENNDELKDRINKGYSCALIKSGEILNEIEVEKQLNTISMSKFFDNLQQEVNNYYEV